VPQARIERAIRSAQVFCGIADDGGFAGGARRGVQTDHLFARHSEHAEGIIGAQVGFQREGKAADVGEAAQIVGVDPCRFEGGGIVRHIMVSMRQRPFQAGQLQRLNFIARGDFDRVKRLAVRGQIEHGVSFAKTASHS
jgi:hypothetical protein